MKCSDKCYSLSGVVYKNVYSEVKSSNVWVSPDTGLEVTDPATLSALSAAWDDQTLLAADCPCCSDPAVIPTSDTYVNDDGFVVIAMSDGSEIVTTVESEEDTDTRLSPKAAVVNPDGSITTCFDVVDGVGGVITADVWCHTSSATPSHNNTYCDGSGTGFMLATDQYDGVPSPLHTTNLPWTDLGTWNSIGDPLTTKPCVSDISLSIDLGHLSMLIRGADFAYAVAWRVKVNGVVVYTAVTGSHEKLDYSAETIVQDPVVGQFGTGYFALQNVAASSVIEVEAMGRYRIDAATAVAFVQVTGAGVYRDFVMNSIPRRTLVESTH